MAIRIRSIKIDIQSYIDPSIYKGFNIAICKSPDTPLESSVATKHIVPEFNSNGIYSHTISNIVLNDSETYTVWVQNVGLGIDSMWRSNSGIEVPDDGVGTVAASFTPEDVQDALDEIDTTTEENVVKINPGNIGNNQINGNHIATTADIKLNEGGAITVGQNNVMLNSVSNDLIIAPDNGVVIGAPDLDGVDFCKLSQGNLNFMYWDGTEHQVYSSLRRVEVGLSVPNNTPVTIPGIWKQPPNIIVSPADIMSYNKNYVANQNLVCTAENITANGLSYTFTPKAFLRMSDGVTNTSFVQEKTVSSPYNSSSWVYGTFGNFVTPSITTSITVNGSIDGIAKWVRHHSGNDEEPGWYENVYEPFYIDAWINIDGVDYLIGSFTDSTGPKLWSYSKTIYELASAQHNVYLKFRYSHVSRWWMRDGAVFNGTMKTFSYSTNQSTFVVLSTGRLNYMAIGE